MNVSLAKTAGFCFGVKRAVDMAYTEAAKGKPVYTLGPIIHNEEVVADLNQKGVLALSEEELFSGKYPLEDATVIIRSHGISKEIYTKLENLSANIVDCTCPFVKKIHTTVEKYAEKAKKSMKEKSEKCNITPLVYFILNTIYASENKEEFEKNKKLCDEFLPLFTNAGASIEQKTAFGNAKKLLGI